MCTENFLFYEAYLAVMPCDSRDRLFHRLLQADKTILSPCLKEEDENGSNGSFGKNSPKSEDSSGETESDPWSQVISEAQIDIFFSIFDNYISENAANQVNIGAKLRKRIEADLSDREAIQLDIFTDAVMEVLELLYMDSYKRFVKVRNEEIASANGSAGSFGSMNSDVSLISSQPLTKRL